LWNSFLIGGFLIFQPSPLPLKYKDLTFKKNLACISYGLVYGLTWWCIDQTRGEGGGPSGSVDRREKEKVARSRRHNLTWMTHGLYTQQQNPCV
jgi:hypothetical protein